MNSRVLSGLGVVAALSGGAAFVGGVNGLIVLVIAAKLVWLAGILTAARAREWWWAVAILVLGTIPALLYIGVRARGPRCAPEPISLFRG